MNGDSYKDKRLEALDDAGFGIFGSFVMPGDDIVFNDFQPFEKTQTDSLPDFPITALPQELAGYIRAVSKELQVAVDMPAVIILGIIALCAQGKFKANPKPGWYEPLNLYTVVIARPSERKSPVVRSVLYPMHQNHECMAIISTEGGVFDMISGRYDRKPNMDIYLKGYSGDSLNVDRKGRESEHIDHPTLTMALTIQPTILDEIMRNDRLRVTAYWLGSCILSPSTVPI